MARRERDGAGALGLAEGLSRSPTRSKVAGETVAPAVTFGLALGVYLLTLAPDLTWAYHGVDGGELITAAVTGGVPHPPGYPTYVLLGKLFSYFPVGTVAYRFNLFSAVCTAGAAAFVAAIVATANRRQPTTDTLSWARRCKAIASPLRGHLVTLSTGLTFAFAPLVWSQAIIAEVYALNALLLSAFLWALLTRRPPLLVGILLGLSVTGHLTSLLMVPLALVLAGRGRWRTLLGGFVIGLLPLAAIPILARGSSPVVWGEPTTWEGWWWLVSGRLYGDNVLALPMTQLWPRLGQWSVALLNNLAWLGLPLLLYGMARTVGRVFNVTFGPVKGVSRNIRDLRSAKDIGCLGLTAAAYAVYALGYNTGDAAVYFIPGLLLLSILLRFGLHAIGRLSLLLPLVLLALNFNALDLSGHAVVRPLALATLRNAPPAAILLTPGDQSLPALWYFQHVEGERPDVIAVDENLLALDWYRRQLRRHHPGLLALEQDDGAGFIQANSRHRPVCRVSVTRPDNLVCFESAN